MAPKSKFVTFWPNQKTRYKLVYQRGQVAPLATFEIVLIGYILSAARVGAPLSCGEVVLLMTTLIAGTAIWEKLYIDYKKKHKIFEPNGNLIGGGWLRGFFRRNGEITEVKMSKPYARNRSENCNYSTFDKMNNQWYDCAVDSGNAVRLDTPSAHEL